MDDVDRAQAREQQLRDDALEAQRRRTQGGGESAVTCSECGEPIPDGRRDAVPGVQLCVDCQELAERGLL